jgi:hypothetical protein
MTVVDMPVASPVAKLGRNGFITGDLLGSDVRTAYAQAFERQASDLSKLVEDEREAEAIVQNDTGLNGKGKQERITAIKAKVEEELTKWIAVPGQFAQDLEEAEKDIPRQLPRLKSDDAGGHIRASEIRRELRALPEVQRADVLRTAAMNGHTEILSAVEHDPLLARPVVKPQVFAGFRDQFFRTIDPAPFKRLDTIKSAIGTYRGNVVQAAKLMGVRLEDKVKDAAQGK